MKSIIGALLLFLATLPAWASDSGTMLMAQTDLTELPLEALLDITVTIASRKEEKLSETAAATFVLTQDDIRRSGATNIPDALRMVPGLQVAQINSNNWAVSSRGFNHRFATKLLVLMDGRTLYTPMFSGVFWHYQDTLLEDIERIEVIRGPGAAMWGANAVNGIINIITKKAKDTQGGLLVGGGGNKESGFGSFRYGGKVGEDLYYKAYVKGFRRDELRLQTGEKAKDDWDQIRGGFKLDWEKNEQDTFTLQGDYYDGTSGDLESVTVPFSPYSVNREVPIESSGGNVLGRWKRKWSEDSEMILQAYYDRADDKSKFFEGFRRVVDTFDIDFQHRFPLRDNQELTWGLGFRYISDEVSNASNVSYHPTNRGTELLSAFIQDEISFFNDKIKVILGTKIEQNDYSDFEAQPNGRILWAPNKKNTLWASVSRAVRTPSRADQDLGSLYAAPIPPGSLYPGSPVALYTIVGNQEYVSEEVIAYELGYRVQPTDLFSLDIAAFFNDYQNLETFETGTPYFAGTAAAPHLVIPAMKSNKMSGETYGVEVSAQWKPFPWWRLMGSYTFLQIQLYPLDSTDPSPKRFEGTSPTNQFTFRSSMDLPKNVELDVFVRYVDVLPEFRIDSYVATDVRIGWSPFEALELSLVGRNLTGAHAEFKDGTFGVPITEIERSVYGKVTWKF